MKNILSKTKTAIVLLLLAIIFLGFYTYMIARPISYGMSYTNKVVFEGETFEGCMRFYPNGKLINKNSNFDEELESYYYYKGGYIFLMLATTDEEYDSEVAYINDNFDLAKATPFYAVKCNAFKQVAEGLDDYVTTYTCNGAIAFAIAGGVLELVLLALTVFSFFLSKKAKVEE